MRDFFYRYETSLVYTKFWNFNTLFHIGIVAKFFNALVYWCGRSFENFIVLYRDSRQSF